MNECIWKTILRNQIQTLKKEALWLPCETVIRASFNKSLETCTECIVYAFEDLTNEDIVQYPLISFIDYVGVANKCVATRKNNQIKWDALNCQDLVVWLSEEDEYSIPTKSCSQCLTRANRTVANECSFETLLELSVVSYFDHMKLMTNKEIRGLARSLSN